MELRLLSLEGFKRFEEKINLQLYGKLVTLVGPNEAGKTSLLKSISYFSDDRKISSSDITSRFRGETKLTLSYFLDRDDQKMAGLSEPTWFDLVKKSDGEIRYNLRPRPRRDTEKRIKCGRQFANIKTNMAFGAFIEDAETSFSRDDVAEIQEILSPTEDPLTEIQISTIEKLAFELEGFSVELPTKLLAKLQAIATSLHELLTFEREHDPFQFAIKILAERAPDILEFCQEDRDLNIPYQITHFNHIDPKIQVHPSKPLRRLIDLSELDLVELIDATQAQDEAAKAGLLEDANSKLKELSSGHWKQSDAYLQFSLEGGNLDILVKHDQGFAIKDKYNNFEDRSDGYKQFVALQVFAFLEKANNAILLIDEIEQHLHYDAQADLVQLLAQEKNIRKVIYTTHSAGCLPEDLGSGIRLVKWDENKKKNSKVVNRFWAEDNSAGFAPLLFGMGATTLSFFPMRKALIGEGATELLLLPTMFREALNLEHLGFQVVHGLANINPKGLPIIDEMNSGTAFITDNDAGGRALVASLKEAGVSDNRIFDIGNIEKVTTLEDLVTPSLWLDAVNRYIDEYGKNIGITKHISDAPDIGRVNDLPEALRSQKINFAYNILDIMAKNHKTKILTANHRKRMSVRGKNIRKLFGLV